MEGKEIDLIDFIDERKQLCKTDYRVISNAYSEIFECTKESAYNEYIEDYLDDIAVSSMRMFESFERVCEKFLDYLEGVD